MKFRITVGEESSVEKPFVIQYKKFLFWRTFKHIIKTEKELKVITPYFSKKGANAFYIRRNCEQKEVNL